MAEHSHDHAHHHRHGAHGHSHGLVDRSIVRSRAGLRAVLLSLAILGATALVQVAIFVVTGHVLAVEPVPARGAPGRGERSTRRSARRRARPHLRSSLRSRRA